MTRIPRLTATATVVAALTAATVGAAPSHADGPRGRGLEHCTTAAPFVCRFDVPPGTYHVQVMLGGDTAGSTSVTAETRRTVLAETATSTGERIHRSFTVDVRVPEGQPTGPAGSPGLDLTFGGTAPLPAGVVVTPAPSATRMFLIGDSTVCDQPGAPYAGWGQQLPQYLKRGVAVANHADSGESTVSYLAHPALFPAVQPLIRGGDPVLIQLAHNDRQTDAATYRANLTTLVDGVRARGGRPVLVSPIVRRWFGTDGTLDNGTALLVNGLGVDHPAEVRRLAADLAIPLIDLTALTKARVEALGQEASKALYLTTERNDDTHTSVRGATEYAALVVAELRAQRIVPVRLIR
ncbi:rhamnogalacturonan acetylesterase [Streptomyces sp. NPDC047971]|uniref:rhamnogalacturonan acetylesterase n=1 Tax=Streptomyces sp. NPDC047971 TaxID=3154499 RepID=UPI0033F09796